MAQHHPVLHCATPCYATPRYSTPRRTMPRQTQLHIYTGASSCSGHTRDFTARAMHRRWSSVPANRASLADDRVTTATTSISASPKACPLRGYGRAGTQNDHLSVESLVDVRVCMAREQRSGELRIPGRRPGACMRAGRARCACMCVRLHVFRVCECMCVCTCVHVRVQFMCTHIRVHAMYVLSCVHSSCVRPFVCACICAVPCHVVHAHAHTHAPRGATRMHSASARTHTLTRTCAQVSTAKLYVKAELTHACTASVH